MAAHRTTAVCTIVGGVMSPLWSNIFLTPFDRAMTEAGYRLTRWADDFVVVGKTRQEAEATLALADRFLREGLGISLHPEKTRIVHVDHGFEFLGYKVKQGRAFGYRRTSARPQPTRTTSTPSRVRSRCNGSGSKSAT